MKKEVIISQLPYSKPFLFVDELIAISEDGVEGVYTFHKEEYFYEGHFKENPVTPGVILTECMAQIGVVCLGIFLIEGITDQTKIALASSAVEYYIPVYPEEQVRVISEKVYFRFGKLKCKVNMFNQAGELVCKGSISGMIANNNKND